MFFTLTKAYGLNFNYSLWTYKALQVSQSLAKLFDIYVMPFKYIQCNSNKKRIAKTLFFYFIYICPPLCPLFALPVPSTSFIEHPLKKQFLMGMVKKGRPSLVALKLV
jgi:hypothetical protein